MTTPRPLFLARLAGTQAEMGTQHARMTAPDAVRLIAFYRSMSERVLAGGASLAEKLAIRGVTTAWQKRLVRDRPPELAARSEAFADEVARLAPGLDRAVAARTLATMDTMQNCVGLAARAGLAPFGSHAAMRARAAALPACATVIAWGGATEGGELLFARNFDFPGVGVWDTAPAFVVCAPDRGQRYAFCTVRGGDVAAISVVNEAGLVMSPHTRWHRDITWGGAMIVDIVHDIARRAETIEDAIRIARERPASSSWGIAIGSARERTAIVLELGGPHVDVMRPSAGAEYITCANVYRTPSLRRGEVSGSISWMHHSARRERRLRALITESTVPLTPRDLARFLGDRRDPSAPERERQFGAIVAQPTNVHAVVIAPATRRSWQGIDRAPCCEGTWAEIGWEWDGPRGGWELGTEPTTAGGFTARRRTDFVAPQSAATRLVHDAMRVYEHDHDVGAALDSIEKAIALEPDDPSLRLVATWIALEAEQTERALIHVHAGLGCEADAYRRGQLLLWGSRTARRVNPAQAMRWRSELEQLSGDGVDELRASARTSYRGRLRPNFVMMDAY